MLFTLACIVSVSAGLSAGLKHFSLFERAKIDASAKKCEKGEGKGGDQCCARPIFAPPKSDKCLERAEKPTETLATQAIFCGRCDWPE